MSEIKDNNTSREVEMNINNETYLSQNLNYVSEDVTVSYDQSRMDETMANDIVI